MNTTDTRYNKEALHSRVENDFTLHPPENSSIGTMMDSVRQQYKALAHFMVDHTPVSREQSLALTHLDDSLKEAIAAIARYQTQAMADYQEGN